MARTSGIGGRVERDDRSRTELTRGENLLGRDPEDHRELSYPRNPAFANRKVVDRASDRDVELAQATGCLHRPPPIAEMPLDFAEDRRRREGRELDAAFRVEAVDRFDQPERCNLNEIV